MVLPNGHSYPNKRPRLEEAIQHEDQRWVPFRLYLSLLVNIACMFLLTILPPPPPQGAQSAADIFSSRCWQVHICHHYV